MYSKTDAYWRCAVCMQMKQYLEGNREEGQVDVLPAERVEQGSCSVHSCTDGVPLLGDHDDAPLQQESGEHRHEARDWHMPEQARQGYASIPGSIAQVWWNLQLNELLRPAGTYGCSDFVHHTCCSAACLHLSTLIL